MLRRLRKFVFIASAVSCLSELASGQAAAINGEISGLVTDSSGAAVPGAIVQVVNPGTGYKQATRTSDSGLYRFSLLPIGTYDLTAQATGFADAHGTGITLNAGATVTVNVPLQVAGASSQVEVPRRPPAPIPAGHHWVVLSITQPQAICRWSRAIHTTSSSFSQTLAAGPTPSSACRAK